jgi:hypothetical protein
VQLEVAVVSIAATAARDGYWLATAAGDVHAFGSASFRGGTLGEAIGQPVVAIAGASGKP